MAKRHNMCWDKRHSCTPIKTIFCLAYIITYIMTFRLPFFWLTLYLFLWFLDLKPKTLYQVRVLAMTQNGTGPPSEWISADTLETDLEGRCSHQRHQL